MPIQATTKETTGDPLTTPRATDTPRRSADKEETQECLPQVPTTRAKLDRLYTFDIFHHMKTNEISRKYQKLK